MSFPTHPHLHMAGEVAEGLIDIAAELVRAAARHARRSPLKRNATLRPGPRSPMWNALILAVRPHLRRWGDKTNLGRELGLPPQRIHEFFVARRAMPDAERTLVILHWLAVRQTLAEPAGRRGRPRFSSNA